MDGLAILAVFLPMVTAVAYYSRSTATNAWSDAAMLTGLSLTDKGRPHGWRLSGKIGRATVLAESDLKTFDDGRPRAHVSIRVRCDIPDSLVAGSEVFWRRWRDTHEGEEHDLGGIAFDEYVVVRGIRAHIFALFGGETRGRFRHLCQTEDIWVEEGSVRLEQTRIFRDGDSLARLLRSMSGLAIGLSLDGPVLPDKLGVNAVTDPNEVVRLRTLDVLTERYPDSQACKQACKHALGDASGPVRVRAASELGAEGFEVLERAATDSRLELETQLRALEALLRIVEAEAGYALVRAHLDDADIQWQMGALSLLCIHGIHPGTEALLSLLHSSQAPAWLAYFNCAAVLDDAGLDLPLAHLITEGLEPGSVMVTLPLRAAPDEAITDGDLETEIAQTEPARSDEGMTPAPAEGAKAEVASNASDDTSVIEVEVNISEELLMDAEVRLAAMKAMERAANLDSDSTELTETDGPTEAPQLIAPMSTETTTERGADEPHQATSSPTPGVAMSQETEKGAIDVPVD